MAPKSGLEVLLFFECFFFRNDSNRKPIGDITNTSHDKRAAGGNAGPLAHSTRNTEAAFDQSSGLLNSFKDLSHVNDQSRSRKFFKKDYSKMTSKQNTKMYSIFDDLSSSESSSLCSFATQIQKKKRSSPIPKELKKKKSSPKAKELKKKSILSSGSSTRSLLREESSQNMPSPPPAEFQKEASKSPPRIEVEAQKSPPKEQEILNQKEIISGNNESNKENDAPPLALKTPVCRQHKSPFKPRRIGFRNDAVQSNGDTSTGNVERFAASLKNEMQYLIDKDTRKSRSKIHQLEDEMKSKLGQTIDEMKSKLRQALDEIEENNAAMKLEIVRTLDSKVTDMLF